MADVTYDKNSLLDFNDIDTVTGNVSVQDNKIVMLGKSMIKYKTITFGENSDISNIKFEYNIHSSNSKLSTRYAQTISVLVKLKYRALNEDDKESYQNITIMPYTTDEDTGSYKFEEISLNKNNVKSMDVTVNFNGDDEIIIEKAKWYKSKNGVDENDVTNIVNDGFSSGRINLCIPVVYELPDANRVPDGYICLLASIV